MAPSSERRIVRALFLQSFLLGLPRLFTAAAATALFLDSFSAGSISSVLMAGAVLVPCGGLLFSFSMGRFGTEKTLGGVLVGLSVVLAGLLGALAATRSAPLARLAVIVWADLEYAFTELVFAAHGNAVLDIRQAKRLFGRAGSGQVLAAILGGLAAPWLLTFLPVEGLLALSLAGLVGAAVNYRRMAGARGRKDAEEEPEAPDPTPIRSAVRVPLIRSLFVLAALEFAVQGFSEALFFDGLQKAVADPGRVASFVARFFAAAAAVKLILGLFVSGPLLTRFGVRAGILAPSVVMAVPLAAHLFSSETGNATLWFASLAAARFLQTVAVSSLYAPAYLTLYQPLKGDLRGPAQTLADTVFGQAGTGLAALALMIAVGSGRRSGPILGILTVAGVALWAAAALGAERRYRREVAARARGTGRLDAARDAGERTPVHRSPRSRRASMAAEAARSLRFRKLSRSVESELLAEALRRESEKAAEGALSALGPAYPRGVVSALRFGALLGEGGRRAYALELAESTLKGGDRKILLPLFDAEADAEAALPPGPQDRPSLLRTLADEAEAEDRAWLRLIALRDLSRCGARLSGEEAGLLARELGAVERAEILSRMAFFSSVPKEDLAVLGRSLEEKTAEAGTRIISRGERGAELYLIVSGSVEVGIEGTRVARLGEGAGVGELSALSPEPRSADVTAVAPTRLLAVGGDTLRSFTDAHRRAALEILKVLNRRILDTLRLSFPEEAPPRQGKARAAPLRSAGRLDAAALERILPELERSAAASARRYAVEAGERIFTAGDEATFFFFISSGKVGLGREGTTILQLEADEFFGDNELILAEDRPFDGIALEKTELVALPRPILFDLLWEGPSFLRRMTLAAAERLRRVTALRAKGRQGDAPVERQSQ